MTDIRLPSSGNIQVRWHPVGAFANPAKPTAAEVNAGLVMTDSISWNDFDFGLSASSTTDDPSLAAKANTSDRGAIQYGGGISVYLPKDFDDMSNGNAVVYAALEAPRTEGYISLQVDGELSESAVPTYVGGLVADAVDGDLIDIYKVMTAGYSNAITGEEAFRETISLLPQGEAYPNTVVATALTVTVAPATATVADGESLALTADVNGRNFTRAVRWTSSDTDAVTVSQNGIATRVAAGAATITATFVGATGTSALS